jgi:drug/metabolite transporter (DMT)-like permease
MPRVAACLSHCWSARSSSRGVLPALATIGIFGVAGDTAFATASREGDLAVVSVLSSLYPVVTVLLAFTLLRERLRRVQFAGVAFAFVGIGLLAGGTG